MIKVSEQNYILKNKFDIWQISITIVYFKVI